MTKSIFITILCSFFIFACKDKKLKPIIPSTNPLSIHPSYYKQKLLLENFESETCASCVYGDAKIDSLLSKYKNDLFVANIHNSDFLAIPYKTTLESLMGGIASYPQGAVNREIALYTVNGEDSSVIVSPQNWDNNITRLFNNVAPLAIGLQSCYDSMNKAMLDIYISYKNPITENTRLMVYLLEDNIKAVNQTSADSNYKHNYVVRQVVSNELGDSISLQHTNDTIIKKQYTAIDLASYNKNNIHFIAFIYKYDAYYRKLKIYNVQNVGLGGIAFWN